MSFRLGPEFTFDETVIGIPGSSGTVNIARHRCGGVREIYCEMKIPGHWIFKTEAKPFGKTSVVDPSDYPVGKDGGRVEFYALPSPRIITEWHLYGQHIGWYGWSTEFDKLQEEFKEMGKYLSSKEAKAQFDSLYEGEKESSTE